MIAENPVVLALTSPSLRKRRRLPAPADVAGDEEQAVPRSRVPEAAENVPSEPGLGTLHSPTTALPPRESLRLRIRWVQEPQVRLVREAARRLGLDAERVGLLR